MKIRVGYVPYSRDLSHPADRRRLAMWAKETKNFLNVENPLDSDVLVLSNAANFGYWLKRAKQPVILDLVDGYLGEKPRIIKDFLRNIVRTFNKQSSVKWITYTRHVKYACKKSALIITASPEQAKLVHEFNSNTFVILDDHSEISEALSKVTNTPSDVSIPRLFWEGFGFTLKHFQFVSKDIDSFLSESGWGLDLVTVKNFPRWSGYLGKIDTNKMVKKMFPKSYANIRIISWSLKNVALHGSTARVGIIPLDPEDKFGQLKSENKLLSMWELGLPVLFSNTPAYSRVAESTKLSEFCIDDNDWYIKVNLLASDYIKLETSKKHSKKYLEQNHSKQILIDQWENVFKKFDRINNVKI